MEKNKFCVLLFVVSLMLLFSCEKNATSPTIDPVLDAHFDIWTPIDGAGGMGDNNYVVKSVNNLDKGEISFQNSGVDVSQKLYPHCIIKDQYYYQITKDGRLGKFRIVNSTLMTEAELPFTLLKERKYCHAWIDDKTLMLMGSNGESTKILWSKINSETMKEIDNGELNLPEPPKGQMFNSSGMLAYRKSDKTFLYSFKYNKLQKNGTEPAPEFYLSFIKSSDMSVIKTVVEKRAEFMSSSAFGELRQDKSFFDENDNYYISCNSVLEGEKNSQGRATSTAQHGAILRVKSGEMDFDKSYNGYSRARGKIITMNYLKNGKALCYMEDPKYAEPSKEPIWDSHTNPYVFYWLIIDLNTQAITDLKDIPLSLGNFSQMAVVAGQKAYIGVNEEAAKSKIYVYDIPTGKLTPGATLAEGFPIERMVWIKD